MSSLWRNIGAYLSAAFAALMQVTAGGSGDAVEVSGPWIDRDGFESCSVVVSGQATLADADTLSLGMNLQDATDSAGAGVADLAGTTIASAVIATGGTGGSTEDVAWKNDFILAGANQFVRAQITPDLSAGATDVATLVAVMILGRPQTI